MKKTRSGVIKSRKILISLVLATMLTITLFIPVTAKVDINRDINRDIRHLTNSNNDDFYIKQNIPALQDQSNEDFLGLSTEKYSSPHWEENGYSGYTTYRIYAKFAVSNMVTAVYGGLNDTLTVYSTDGIFYNDLTYPSLRPPEDHTQEGYWANLWDTYVTIGCALNCGGLPSFAPSEEIFAELTGNLSGNFTLTGDDLGAWFITPVDPLIKILLAQFTVAEGERIGGYLNIQDYEGQIYLNVPFGLEAADINQDTYVDVLDLLEVLAHWGEIGGPADVNNDGIVDMLDILVVLAHWS